MPVYSQIGYVNKWTKLSNSSIAELSAYDSYIGGTALCFNEGVTVPKCEKCQNTLYLVAQIYAEAGRARNLLIFGCNNSACYKNKEVGSWVTIRTQGEPFPVVEKKKEEIKPPETTSAFSSFGFGGSGGFGTSSFDDNSNWGCDNAWGSDESIQKAVSALSAITLEKEEDIVDQPIAPSYPILESSSSFPFFSLSTFEYEEVDTNDDDDDDNITRNLHTKTSKSDDAHIHKLLKDYEEFERVSMSQPDTSKSSPSIDAANLGEEDEEDVGKMKERKGKSAAASGSSFDNKLKDHKESKGTKGGDGYEDVPAAMKALLNFQNAIADAGNALVRYAFNEKPWWPIPIPSSFLNQKAKHVKGKKDILPPPCECGAARCFEVQLLPGILEGLQPDLFTVTKMEHGLNETGNLKTTLTDLGMDFLTVLVFSCENSCGSSKTEWTYVVPADED